MATSKKITEERVFEARREPHLFFVEVFSVEGCFESMAWALQRWRDGDLWRLHWWHSSVQGPCTSHWPDLEQQRENRGDWKNSFAIVIYHWFTAFFPLKKTHTTASSCIQQALGHWLDFQKMPPWFAQGFACSVKSSQWPILSGRIRSNESMKEKTSSDIFTHIFPPS